MKNKTLFTKCEDSLPKESGNYLTNCGPLYFEKNNWYDNDGFYYTDIVTGWLDLNQLVNKDIIEKILSKYYSSDIVNDLLNEMSLTQ